MFSLFKDRIFLRNLGWLAIPIIINEMLNSLINMMDTFYDRQIGGQASVTQLDWQEIRCSFSFSLITFGICSGAAIFFLWGGIRGNNDIKSVHKVMVMAPYLMVIIDSGGCFFCYSLVFFTGKL